MTLLDCLDSMRGCGVILKRNGGGLVIQSATFVPNTIQKTTLSAHKPLLLGILPDGAGFPVEVMTDVMEAYFERLAIVGIDADSATAEQVAHDQVQRLLLSA